MTVNTFDPNDLGGSLDSILADELCELVRRLDDEGEVFNEQEAARFLALAMHTGWQSYADKLDEEVIRGLVRFFTIGEMKFSGWRAGDKSPVIGLVKVLKKRGVFESEFTRWIKAHTDNKFLPHGNLKDLL